MEKPKPIQLQKIQNEEIFQQDDKTPKPMNITGPRFLAYTNPSPIQKIYNEEQKSADIGLNIIDPVEQDKYFVQQHKDTFWDGNRQLDFYLDQSSPGTIDKKLNPSSLHWDESSGKPPPYHWDYKPPSFEIGKDEFVDDPNYLRNVQRQRAHTNEIRNRRNQNTQIIAEGSRYRDPDSRSTSDVLRSRYVTTKR